MSPLRTALICEMNMMSLMISGRVKSVNPQTSVDEGWVAASFSSFPEQKHGSPFQTSHPRNFT